MSDVNDELDGSPILEEVLGDALGKLKVFHVKQSTWRMAPLITTPFSMRSL